MSHTSLPFSANKNRNQAWNLCAWSDSPNRLEHHVHPRRDGPIHAVILPPDSARLFRDVSVPGGLLHQLSQFMGSVSGDTEGPKRTPAPCLFPGHDLDLSSSPSTFPSG